MPLPPRAADRARRRQAGMADYLREAFLFRWNLLLFLGGAAAAALTPLRRRAAAAGRGRRADLPRRARLDPAVPRRDRRQGPRRAAAARPDAGAAPPPRRRCVDDARRPAAPTRASASSGCTRAASRCATIAAGVRGAAGDQRQRRRGDPHARPRSAAVAVPAPAAVEDRARSLPADDERDGDHRAARRAAQEPRGRAEPAATSAIVRSLQDSIAMAELRLDNYGRARKNAEFVVDRARSHRRQDPGARRDGGQPAGSRISSAARSTRRPRACGRPRRRSASCST